MRRRWWVLVLNGRPVGPFRTRTGAVMAMTRRADLTPLRVVKAKAAPR